MTRVRLVWLGIFVVCGCGRIDFGATAGDASQDGVIGTLGHDEDGDGVPDTLDVCPHLADDQTDSDHDGVGDACDWEPLIPRQHIAVFATMQPNDQPFQLDFSSDAWTQLGDAIHFDGNGAGSLVLHLPIHDARVAVGMDVLAVVGTGQHQLAVTVDDPQSVHDFVEFNEIQGTFSNAQITHFDGSTYSLAQGTALLTGLHLGAIALQETAVVNTSVTMDGGWAGEPYHVVNATTVYQGGVGLLFNSTNVAIDLRYVCLITAD